MKEMSYLWICLKKNQWIKKTECIQALLRMLLQEKALLESTKRY